MPGDRPDPLPPEALDAAAGGQGLHHTFRNGTPGNDTLRGDAGGDHMRGGGGDDVLLAGAGDDILRGHAGNDDARGGAGQDSIHGDDGDDTLEGGNGDGAGDSIAGGTGNDVLFWMPGDGNGTLLGGSGMDRVQIGLGPWMPADPTPRAIFESLVLDRGAAVCVHGMLDSFVPVPVLVMFVGEGGNLLTDVSGSFTLNGQTVRFQGIEALEFVFAFGG